MSVENVTKFYIEVMKDNELKGKLRDVNEKTLTEEVFKDKVFPEAKAKGYDFTYEDVEEYYKKQGEKTELSLDDMEAVSGGTAGNGCNKDKYAAAKVGPEDRCFYVADVFEPWGSFDWSKDEKKCRHCKHFNLAGYCEKRVMDITIERG